MFEALKDNKVSIKWTLKNKNALRQILNLLADLWLMQGIMG